MAKPSTDKKQTFTISEEVSAAVALEHMNSIERFMHERSEIEDPVVKNYFDRLNYLGQATSSIPYPSAMLEAYWEQHHNTPAIPISLVAGEMRLPPPLDSAHIAQRAEYDSWENLGYGTIVRKQELKATRNALTSRYGQIVAARTLLTSDELLQMLHDVLASEHGPMLRDASLDHLHPAIADYVRAYPSGEERSDVFTIPEVPINRKERRDFIDSIVKIICLPLMAEIVGSEATAREGSIIADFAISASVMDEQIVQEGLAQIKQRIEEEIGDLDNQPVQVMQRKNAPQTKDLLYKTVKPAIARRLHHYHGIHLPERNGRYNNKTLTNHICVDLGSSLPLMHNAMNAIAETFPEEKKALCFGAAWDGLPYVASYADNLSTEVIPGSLDAEALDQHITRVGAENVGMLVLNIPEIPSGYMPTESELSALAAVIIKHDISHVLVDELFAALPVKPGHDGHDAGVRSLASFEGMEERCFVVSSTSKIFNDPQKKYALCYGYTGNAKWMKAVQNTLDEKGLVVPPLVRGATFLEETPAEYFVENEAHFKASRMQASTLMEAVNQQYGLQEGLRWHREPNHGFQGIVTFPPTLLQQAGITDTFELSEYLFKMGWVAAGPCHCLGEGPDAPIGVRINVDMDPRLLEQAFQQIAIATASMGQTRYNQIAGIDTYSMDMPSGGMIRLTEDEQAEALAFSRQAMQEWELA